MIIELVGLPGAGKTTYARRLSQLDRYTRVRIESRLELIGHNLLFLFRFPLTSVRLFGWFVRYRGPRTLWYTKFTSIFLDYNAKYMKARSVPYAVLDQGHLQTLFSLFETELPEVARSNLIRLLPKADHYVFFNISESVRLNQLGERGYTSREGLMSEALRESWQKTAAIHFQWLRAHDRQLASATIDTVTETTDITEWAKRYQSARFMRYITFARMPTEKAHGLQIATMCTEFQKSGHFVSLVTPRRKNPIAENVTDYYQLPIPLQHQQIHTLDIIGAVKKVRQLHHYLHELLFTIAVFFYPLPSNVLVYTRTPLVAKAAAWRGRLVVAELHFWPNRGRRFMSWLLRGDTVKLVANSEGTRDAMAKHDLTALVAHNGFPEEWLDIKMDKIEARQHLGIATDLPVVMYVGSLGKWKGVDTLCEAGAILKDKVQVVVVGGSTAEVEEWQTRYRHVIFTGARPYVDLGWIQKAADILVVPNNPKSVASERYTSPIKLFAHLASGRPVVVSDLPPIRAIVDERSAWFFVAGDKASLADTFEIVLLSEQEAEVKLSAAYKVAKGFTWSEKVSKLQFINQL